METYLTQSERNVMWRHLLVTSLVLVLATATLILWAAVVVSRDRARDMTLLPSEVCCKDGHKLHDSYQSSVNGIKGPRNLFGHFFCDETFLNTIICVL